MPILFGLFGIVLIVAGVRNRVSANGSEPNSPALELLLIQDFTGDDPFWKWMLAIIFIGSIGYIPNLRPISRAFLVLVIIVFMISNKGIFTQLEQVFAGTSGQTTPETSTQGALE